MSAAKLRFFYTIAANKSPDGVFEARVFGPLASFVIQPGGSQRDEEVLEACDSAGVAMVLTSRRHFRH